MYLAIKTFTKECNFIERQKRMAPRSEGESERKDEEDWQLKDVVFVEDVKTVPIGMIIIFIPISKIFTVKKFENKL
jgi:hypothetical protein